VINPNFVIIGVILQLIGGLGYLLDTLKGRVKPNKVSWLLWSIAPLVAFFAEIKQGVGIVSLTTFITGFVPLLIFIASFFNKKSEWNIKKLDIICGILSILGLTLWLVTKVGNIAIFFSILADGLAAIPTIVKSYEEPETESDLVYLMAIVNAGIRLLVIRVWNFEHWGFPLYLFLLDLLLVILIRFKLGKKLIKKSSTH
jgi:hypothetical protein